MFFSKGKVVLCFYPNYQLNQGKFERSTGTYMSTLLFLRIKASVLIAIIAGFLYCDGINNVVQCAKGYKASVDAIITNYPDVVGGENL